MDIIPSTEREKIIARCFFLRGLDAAKRLAADGIAEHRDEALQRGMEAFFLTRHDAQMWCEDREIEDLRRRGR